MYGIISVADAGYFVIAFQYLAIPFCRLLLSPSGTHLISLYQTVKCLGIEDGQVTT